MLNKGKPLAGFSPWRWAFLAMLTVVIAPCLSALEVGNSEPPPLVAGHLRHGQINLDSNDHSATFRLKVEPDIYAIRLSLQSANADLDLAITDLGGNELWTKRTPNWNETLQVYRMGSPSLEDGDYLVKVSFPNDYHPTSKGQVLSTIEFDIDYKPVRVNQFETLTPGILRKDTLEPDSGMQKAYRIQVPAGTTQLRLDVFGSQTDTDIYGQARVPFSDPRLAGYAAQTWRSRESLIIPIPKINLPKFGTAAADSPIPVYVMILSEMEDVPAEFEVIASIGSAVPTMLQALPALDATGVRADFPGLTQALSATVEIITDSGGGSGCVISPDGWILTNYHVIRGNGGVLSPLVSVGFTLDAHLVPDSQFWAELTAIDESRDLALLHIVSGFYQQALPKGYQFPWMRLASSMELQIGDTLYFAGYPTIGGIGNRATITCSEGIISGFQARNGINYIKTAAMISSGNSGGAALDRLGRLIGIPTLVVGSEASQLAYISSIETVPISWLKLAHVQLNRVDGNTQPEAGN